eukprot:TRINITY_DN650_c2_g1_i3.p1 TRINITY_DN650_c2_g1~~TRINITY_DN650_c2_g1_i3.p1  ORF type:complete len:604 (-),score=309.16 TRINITY_DN650_c2_g1_i3:103-1914(-)
MAYAQRVTITSKAGPNAKSTINSNNTNNSVSSPKPTLAKTANATSSPVVARQSPSSPTSKTANSLVSNNSNSNLNSSQPKPAGVAKASPTPNLYRPVGGVTKAGVKGPAPSSTNTINAAGAPSNRQRFEQKLQKIDEKRTTPVSNTTTTATTSKPTAPTTTTTNVTSKPTAPSTTTPVAPTTTTITTTSTPVAPTTTTTTTATNNSLKFDSLPTFDTSKSSGASSALLDAPVSKKKSRYVAALDLETSVPLSPFTPFSTYDDLSTTSTTSTPTPVTTIPTTTTTAPVATTSTSSSKPANPKPAATKKSQPLSKPTLTSSPSTPVINNSSNNNVTSSTSTLTTSNAPAVSQPTTPAAATTHAVLEKKKTSRYVSALDVEGLQAPKKAGVANLWQQQMDQKKNDEFQARRTARKGKVRGGIDFMDNSIRQLIDIIKELSKQKPQKTIYMAAVSYGDLFSHTIDTMPALSATISCAKKRGVVEYEGALLMQGTHDNVIINLIADEVTDSEDFKSIYGAVPPPKHQSDTVVEGVSKCNNCGKTVYVNERLGANGKVFHKSCFRCCVCQCVLKLGAFSFLDNKFFCDTHFQQAFKKNANYITGFDSPN